MCIGYTQILHHFIRRTCVCVDFGIHMGPRTNPTQAPKIAVQDSKKVQYVVPNYVDNVQV